VSKDFKFKRGFKTKSEDIAVQYRSYLNLSAKDPMPAKNLAEHLGIKVLTPHDVFKGNHETLDYLINSEEWSALTLPCKSGDRVIIHNSRHSKARQESNIMHEIAHIICEHKAPTNNIGIVLRDYNEEQEKEAEWLGGCLQLPREALIWALERKMNNDEIAVFFNASNDMVRFRLNKTGAKLQFLNRRRFS
jgi:Zn-dependent peptidase ImmA (M78 family)